MEPVTPTALLSIRVRGPAQTHSRPHSQQRQRQQRQQPQEWNGAARTEEEPLPIEVLVRSAGKYLPARVARCRWAVDGAKGARGPTHSPGLTDTDCHEGGDERDDGGGGSGDTDGSGAVVGPNGYLECQYDVGLLAPPPAPGLVLVEVRRRHDGATSVPPPPGFADMDPRAASDVMPQLSGGSILSEGIDLVPVLVTDDVAIAEELNGLASSWPGGKDRELDGLLYDLGTWMAAAAAADGFGAGDAAPAAAAATVPATITATAAGSAAMAEKESQGGAEVGLDAALPAVLGPHLIEFMESVGLAATAAGIRTRIRPPLPLLSPPQQLSQQQPREKQEPPQQEEQPDLDEEPRLTNKTSGPAAGMVRGGGEFGTSCHSPGFGGQSEVRGGCRGMADGGWQFSLLASALLQVLGLQATTRSSAAAYNTFMGAWCAAQGQTVQVVECLALLCMLIRAGWSGLQPMGPTTIVCVMGCGISALMTLAWLVLPYRSWVRLARAVQIPRYLGHTGAKILVVLGFLRPAWNGYLHHGRRGAAAGGPCASWVMSDIDPLRGHSCRHQAAGQRGHDARPRGYSGASSCRTTCGAH
ncbi:hypothetical protein Vretimale_3129 [Volvox reticuliferus]|uniref:Uncharacterized protein n=1 Tax=Volvox reticuliferus TaxID=1737510 RepID=A0A8J4G3E8_9CHLO|nr:hypothetical protein Vretimale_3129 [Volvox reticuliferus]